ncbi:MAG: radical SAM protein, partial [Candidatus Omnitrophica bacterium]|nr:radical SAM protein [Candidatus Omnitrophota bacterium]
MTLPIKNGWFGRKRHIRLYMDLSTTCDIRCVQCFREAIIPPPMKVTRAQLEILEREVFPYIERLSLSCTGEPLYLPIFPEALRAAKRAGVPYVRIQTNATHLDEAMSALLLDEGLSHLGVSLDAATKETFERIRVGADWEMVTGNIRRFVEMRNARRRVEPEVSLNFTLMTDNCHEALPLIDLARDLGVTSISYHHMIVERPEMKSHNLAYDPPRMNALLQSLREQAAARGV